MLYSVTLVTVNEDMLVSGRIVGVSIVWLLAVTTLLSGTTRLRRKPTASRDELRRALTMLSHKIRYAPESWNAVTTDAMYDIRPSGTDGFFEKLYICTRLTRSNTADTHLLPPLLSGPRFRKNAAVKIIFLADGQAIAPLDE